MNAPKTFEVGQWIAEAEDCPLAAANRADRWAAEALCAESDAEKLRLWNDVIHATAAIWWYEYRRLQLRGKALTD